MGSPSQTRNATYRWPASKSTVASVRTPDVSPRRGSYWMKPVAIAAPFHSSPPITPSITGGIAVRNATISFEFDVVLWSAHWRRQSKLETLWQQTHLVFARLLT